MNVLSKEKYFELRRTLTARLAQYGLENEAEKILIELIHTWKRRFENDEVISKSLEYYLEAKDKSELVLQKTVRYVDRLGNYWEFKK